MSVRKPLEAIFAHLYTPPSEDLAATPTREEVTVPSSQEVDVNTQAEGGDPPSQEPAPEAAVDVPAPAPEVVRDEYDDRIGNITANLEQTLQLTKAAAQHLNSARQLALEHDLTEIAQLDQLHGREHRKTGLPPGEPLLALDPSLLDEHGLLRARDLLKEVQEQAARRSAQPGGGLDILAEEASSRPQPHFMLSTRAFDAQLEARQSLTATVRSLKTLREQSREKQLTDVKPRVGTKLPPQLTMEEQQENIKVLRRMHGPLGFMRNPRYVLPPRKPASEAAPMPLAVPRRDTFIHVIPETINFVDYEAGGVYEIPVMLQNASSLARRVRVLPPASKFFSITLLSYPSNEGHIAPGMHASMRVRFAPDSLADYEDFLVVQTEMDSFPLPLHACRTPPLLTLPATLECGCCFVGGKTTITFSAKNEGGAGRFYIADKERWDSGDREIVASLCTEAFQVTPTLLDLQPGDEFTVSVTFTPPHATPFLVPLLLVCDNCRVKEVRLAGIGCITSLQLESIDGLAPQGELPQQETIDFGEVGMYTKHTKILRLLNETPLPVDFEWDHFALPPKCAPLTRFMGDAPEKLRRSELIGPLRVDDASTEYPFSISPRHGSLAAGEAATFELSFEPHVAQLWSTAIMLSTLNIPASAMPGASSLLEVGLRMFGRGVGSDLEVIDMNGMVAPALLLQGGSQIFKEVPVRLLLRNPNESTRAFRWVSDTAPVDDTSQSFLLDVTPSEGVIEGGGTAEVTVCMCGTSLGMLRRTLNFESTPHGRPIKLPLELLVVGPQVMIRSRCLDYGLLPLGESRTQMLEIENLSDLPAKFMLTPAALPNSPEAIHAAKAQAAVVGSPVELEDNALCDPIKDWAWVDNEVDANHKETELALLHRFAGIEPARCIGEVPGESITQIPVTLRPGAEQSLRRNLSLRVMHGQTAYVGVRAEVVQRKATLNLHELHLGTTYLRVSADRTVTLRNLTNIPTDFAWRSQIKEGSATVACTPASGTLAGGQEISVLVETVPLEPGPLKVLVGCELHGGTVPPIGFRLDSDVQGLVVVYDVFSPDDHRLRDLPPVLQPPGAGMPITEAGQFSPRIDFGNNNPIFEAKSLVVIMRNFSAIRTRFQLAPTAYPTAELPAELQEPPSVQDYTQTASMLSALKRADVQAKREAEAREHAARVARGESFDQITTTRRSTSKRAESMTRVTKAPSMISGTSRAAFNRPLLTNAHEQAQPFFSQTGVTFSAQRALRRREAALLAGRRGAAFEVSPSEGQLEPWAQVAVTITLHSNMWGCFNDQLNCDVAGLPMKQLPLLASVVGCPLRLHDATLGLSNRTVPPTLSWAPVPVGASIQTKTIRVENLGPEDAHLNWRVVQPNDASKKLAANLVPTKALVEYPAAQHQEGVDESHAFVNGVIRDALVETIGTEVRLGIVENTSYREFDDSAPFSVSPSFATIPRGGDYSFLVSFQESHVGSFEAMLVGQGSHTREVPLASGRSSSKHPELKLRLVSDTITPLLELSERCKLKFKVSTTDPKEHPSYTRPLVMTNSSASPLEFSLSTGSPFRIVESTASSPQFKLLNKTGIFVLAPKESLKTEISFVPPRCGRKSVDHSADDESRSAVSSISTAKTNRTSCVREAINEDPHLMHRTTTESLLTVRFSNGTVQTFPLVAVTTSPYLELSETSLSFRRSHLDEEHVLELGLFNPTEVDAKWSLSHIPSTDPEPLPASRRAVASAAAADKSIDDPSVFIFSAEDGTVPARKGSIPRRVPLKIRFRPSAVGEYKCQFMFKVHAGISTRCEISAEATLREEDRVQSAICA